MIAESSTFLVPHDHLSLEAIIPYSNYLWASKMIFYIENENKNINI